MLSKAQLYDIIPLSDSYTVWKSPGLAFLMWQSSSTTYQLKGTVLTLSKWPGLREYIPITESLHHAAVWTSISPTVGEHLSFNSTRYHSELLLWVTWRTDGSISRARKIQSFQNNQWTSGTTRNFHPLKKGESLNHDFSSLSKATSSFHGYPLLLVHALPGTRQDLPLVPHSSSTCISAWLAHAGNIITSLIRASFPVPK